MTPERVARLIARWTRLYTAGLSRPVADRRREEIAADVHEQVTHERSAGLHDSRIALGLASRALRGATADMSWRGRQRRADHTNSPEEQCLMSIYNRSTIRVTAFVLAVLAVPYFGTALSEDVQWSVFDFVLAGAVLAVIGASFELARLRRGNVAIGAVVAVLGAAAAAVGELDDAPGLVLLGGLLIASGAAVAYRNIRTLH